MFARCGVWLVPARRRGRKFKEETLSPAHTYGWTYDLAGNRLTETGAVSTSYAPNSVNEHSSITGSPLGEGNPGYDADGNLTQDATWTYSYDCENRLTSMTKSGQGLTFKYDYLGRRIEKIVTGTGASDTKYLWAGWTLVAELSSNGTTVNRGFVYGPDFSDGHGNAGGAGSLLAQVDNGVATYTVPDVLGNVAGYVSNAGTLTAAVEYSPYGRVISTSGTYSNYPIGYAGQYTDWETGLVCYGHRYYWPKHGRFINRDPIEEQGGFNLYAFCLNGPTFRWDVLGNLPSDYSVASDGSLYYDYGRVTNGNQKFVSSTEFVSYTPDPTLAGFNSAIASSTARQQAEQAKENYQNAIEARLGVQPGPGQQSNGGSNGGLPLDSSLWNGDVYHVVTTRNPSDQTAMYVEDTHTGDWSMSILNVYGSDSVGGCAAPSRSEPASSTVTPSQSDYWDRYLQHIETFSITTSPAVGSTLIGGGVMPKSWVPRTGGAGPALGSSNPLTSVLRGVIGSNPTTTSGAFRAGTAVVAVAGAFIGGYNVGVLLSGFVYAAFPGSNGLPVSQPQSPRYP